MEMVKKAYRRLLELLGVTSAPAPMAPSTKLQVVVAKYNATPESDRQAFLEAVVKECITALAETEKITASQSQDSVSVKSSLFAQVKAGLENAEIALFFIRERDKAKGNGPTSLESEDDLLILQSISRLLAALAIPGKSWTEKFERYLHLYEEQLILTEARGEYKLKISENGEWIKLPLLQYLKRERISKEIAREELLQFFYDCPQVVLIELDARVPMLPTSILDTKQIIESKRVTPLYLKDKEEWFLLLV